MSRTKLMTSQTDPWPIQPTASKSYQIQALQHYSQSWQAPKGKHTGHTAKVHDKAAASSPTHSIRDADLSTIPDSGIISESTSNQLWRSNLAAATVVQSTPCFGTQKIAPCYLFQICMVCYGSPGNGPYIFLRRPLYLSRFLFETVPLSLVFWYHMTS